MSMNSIADIDNYDSFNFHYTNIYEQKRPLRLTTQTNVYSLSVNAKGDRQYICDTHTGRPLASPRSLLMLCVNSIVSSESSILKDLSNETVSANVFGLVFKEAIFCGELSLISHLISIWPNSYLKLSDLIPNEIINADSLSRPLFSSGPTVLDYVLLGLLVTRKGASRLRTIDFTGFHRDLKLSKEVAHLPLLWIKPENRFCELINEKIKAKFFIQERSLERYLDNFNDVYQEYDRLVNHEMPLEDLTLVVDCHINCEDVAIGLALQNHTPFRFLVKKAWCSYGLDNSLYSFSNYNFLAFINPNALTHLCLKDLFMIKKPNDITALCSVLENLHSIVALSLIRVINFYPENYTNEETLQICSRLNRFLKQSYKLNKLDLSFNFLRSRLNCLLRGLVQPLDYLNLQDCHLDSTDTTFLNTPDMLKTLRSCKELNLAMNDFRQDYPNVFSVISHCTQLSCLSLSHCQIPVDIVCANLVLRVFLGEGRKFSKLKFVMLQPLVAPKTQEIVEIIQAFSGVKSLQKLSFLPSLHAFPGVTEVDRQACAFKVVKFCAGLLEAKGRSDIDFVDF